MPETHARSRIPRGVVRRQRKLRTELAILDLPDFRPMRSLCTQVDFVSEPIRRFTKTGIETADGKVLELDVVFCATGVLLANPSPPPRHTSHGARA